MIQEIKLSKRLKSITQFLDQGCYFSDIGSDHAYLPIVVCQKDPTAKAIAGELNEGPFQAARDNVKRYHLEHQIEVIKGDGLTVIDHKPVREVVIAGMGGGLIRSILDNGRTYLKDVERLILQPNINSYTVREWLNQTSYQLVDEVILTEEDHTYEILVADKLSEKKQVSYSEKELFFGPFLLKNKNQAFRKKWQSELINYERILKQMSQAKNPDKAKVKQYQQKILWIEEVLINESFNDDW